ncbi:hypothetical protein LSH36_79g11099 [Paralvinella palmiformis]|uniref:C2H2-type domain-containing protein n=1 Tax=Paralvinella palmiformis TaxID=53620 RepID=A0AAD9NB20_9ANNE|nr:hypothetical protein LSH36_79g11099 [Paralvinella palmiformis]
MKSAHLNVRFICDLCGKWFTYSDNLKRHQRTVHATTNMDTTIRPSDSGNGS